MLKRKHRPSSLLEIGWREMIALPDLGILMMKAKIDTGARTSALHARIDRVYHDGPDHLIDFRIPVPGSKKLQSRTAKLVDQRAIKNTSGIADERYVIETTLVLGRRHWQIELTLADREKMNFDIILGRTAIREHKICVNPGRSFLLGNPEFPVSTPNQPSDGIL